MLSSNSYFYHVFSGRYGDAERCWLGNYRLTIPNMDVEGIAPVGLSKFDIVHLVETAAILKNAEGLTAVSRIVPSFKINSDVEDRETLVELATFARDFGKSAPYYGQVIAVNKDFRLMEGVYSTNYSAQLFAGCDTDRISDPEKVSDVIRADDIRTLYSDLASLNRFVFVLGRLKSEAACTAEVGKFGEGSTVRIIGPYVGRVREAENTYGTDGQPSNSVIAFKDTTDARCYIEYRNGNLRYELATMTFTANIVWNCGNNLYGRCYLGEAIGRVSPKAYAAFAVNGTATVNSVHQAFDNVTVVLDVTSGLTNTGTATRPTWSLSIDVMTLTKSRIVSQYAARFPTWNQKTRDIDVAMTDVFFDTGHLSAQYDPPQGWSFNPQNNF